MTSEVSAMDPLVDLSTLRSVADLVAHQKDVAARISALHDEHAGQPLDEQAREEFSELAERSRECDLRIQELSARQRLVGELARRPENVERPEPQPAVVTRTVDREGLDLGLRAIERHSAHLSTDAGTRLERLVRSDDPLGIGARYLSAVGDPHYHSAFGKLITDPTTGHLRFSPQEVAAVRAVSHAMSERAMSEGVTTAGGFAIPFTLDRASCLARTAH
jgi:hypothetical protein